MTVHAIRAARTSHQDNEIVVFPEGICQRSFMAFVDGEGLTKEGLVHKFVEGAPQPDAIVVLKVTPRLALERLRARGHGGLSYRFKNLTEHQLENQLEMGQELLLGVVQHLLATSSHPIFSFLVEADDLSDALHRLERDCFPTLIQANSGPPP